MPDQQPVVSQRARDAAEETEKLLYAHHVIKYDGDAALRCARRAFAKFEAETTAEVETMRDENARLREVIHSVDALAIGSNCRGGGKITLDFEQPKAAYKAFTIISDAYNSSSDSTVPEGMERRPFAYCCAEGGGDVNACDCVNKNHGTALFPVRNPARAASDAADRQDDLYDAIFSAIVDNVEATTEGELLGVGTAAEAILELINQPDPQEAGASAQ